MKWKTWTAILAIGASVVIEIGPLITGNYLLNLLSPIELAPFVCAIRLTKPVSWWAKWFYWRPIGSDGQLLQLSPKLATAPNLEEAMKVDLGVRVLGLPEPSW